MQVFAPGMAVVDDELYLYSATSPSILVLAAVVDVFASNVLENDGPLQGLLKPSNVSNGGTSLAHEPFPPTPGFSDVMWGLARSTLEHLHSAQPLF